MVCVVAVTGMDNNIPCECIVAGGLGLPRAFGRGVTPKRLQKQKENNVNHQACPIL